MTFNLPKYTWDKDRELCKQCKHYRERLDNPRYHSGVVIMLCAVNPHKGSRGIGTCSQNRSQGPCGIEGRLFQPHPEYHKLLNGLQQATKVEEELKWKLEAASLSSKNLYS